MLVTGGDARLGQAPVLALEGNISGSRSLLLDERDQALGALGLLAGGILQSPSAQGNGFKFGKGDGVHASYS
jgi:hypothetical protein